jgi:hypothetical protein
MSTPGSVSSEISFLIWPMTAFFPHHMASFLITWLFSYKDMGQIGLDPTMKLHFNLITF